jgi:hypothetical protein
MTSWSAICDEHRSTQQQGGVDLGAPMAYRTYYSHHSGRCRRKHPFIGQDGEGLPLIPFDVGNGDAKIWPKRLHKIERSGVRVHVQPALSQDHFIRTEIPTSIEARNAEIWSLSSGKPSSWLLNDLYYCRLV